MLDRAVVEDKMKEREFTLQVVAGGSQLHFLSNQAFEYRPVQKPDPIISVIFDLDKEEFECVYSMSGSLNKLVTPSYGVFMNDSRFDGIVG